jgi:hypothetical protein
MLDLYFSVSFLLMLNIEKYAEQPKSTYTIAFKSPMTWNYGKVSLIVFQTKISNFSHNTAILLTQFFFV